MTQAEWLEKTLADRPPLSREQVSRLRPILMTAGAMTAAEFLHSFVGKTPWAHLDIAGPSFVDGDSRMYYGHGATGYGVRLCVDLIKKS